VGLSALDAEPADILEMALKAADVEESEEDWKEDAPLRVLSRMGYGPSPGTGRAPRVASRVLQTSRLHPSLNPPPLFAHYLRGIAAKTILEAMCDIQLEAARIRHGLPEDCNVLEKLRSQGYVPLCRGNWGVASRERGSPEAQDREEGAAGLVSGGEQEWLLPEDEAALREGEVEDEQVAAGASQGPVPERQDCWAMRSSNC